MASSEEKKKPLTHAALREKLLKEEEMLAKFKEFSKFLQSWERGRVMCLQLKSQEDRCFARSGKRHQAEMKEEMHYANKQLMMLRQAALKHLLSTEHLQYQLEFNHLGMSFYAERL
ncbi:cilia- and flagella-associated protein 141 [Pantherophis guttatus]|uniref:Cilia- and flagella-associated protein 141 n=1 Tax=Pantherophis guttatus TaxID=94885 RepID=A0A6P9BN93_PANGU|nr:cilia- and flagella-associated protein 141 [Pantherophis guttatus]